VSSAYAAVDLGAASGRVMVGTVGSTVELTEVARFANEPVRLPSGLHWDILHLYASILTGLRATAGAPRSVAVDSWAVDYGLLDAGGALLGLPHHYRDPRTEGIAEPAPGIYARTGIQRLPINTLFQLLAEPRVRLDAAHTLLMIPDLIGYWLTGAVGAERTNASTTMLYDATARDWSYPVIEAAGLPRRLFPPLRDPGDRLGPLLPWVREATGLACHVVAVGSHDTASAVAAVPAATDRFAYVSCGTWSLVGVELPAPVLTEESRLANFTNEAGLDGTIRYLRNVMGLWLLQECQRTWRDAGQAVDTAALLAAAARERPFAALVDPDLPEFLPAGDMPARIDAYCRRTGQTPPATPAAYARCVLESLAVAHRATVRDAMRLSGREVEVVHVVGGGARSALLCQLTADACGLPVIAGPVEATALGNVLTQARTDGGPPDLPAMRALVATSTATKRYDPDPAAARAWSAAAARVGRP